MTVLTRSMNETQGRSRSFTIGLLGGLFGLVGFHEAAESIDRRGAAVGIVSAGRSCSWIRPGMDPLRQRRTLVRLLFVISLILLWTGHVGRVAIDDSVPPGPNWYSQTPAPSLHWNGDVSFTVNRDGRFCKLGPDMEELWSFSSGPLASMSFPGGEGDGNSSDASSPGPEDLERVVLESDIDVVIFSAKDQEFTAHAKRVDGNALSTLRGKGKRLTPDEVLVRTPRCVDGTVVIGDRSTIVFALNGSTGGLLRTVAFGRTQFEDKENVSNLGKLVPGGDKLVAGDDEKDSAQDTLYIARTNYKFEARDMKTGSLLWSLSLARVNLLPENWSEGIDPFGALTPIPLGGHAAGSVPCSGVLCFSPSEGTSSYQLAIYEGARSHDRLPSDSRRLQIAPAHVSPLASGRFFFSHILSAQYVAILGIFGILGPIGALVYRRLHVRAPKPEKHIGHKKKSSNRPRPGKDGILGKQGKAKQKVPTPGRLQRDGGEAGAGTGVGGLFMPQDKVNGHGSKDGGEGGAGSLSGGPLVSHDNFIGRGSEDGNAGAAYQVGGLVVHPRKVIGQGSNGTVVLEGSLGDGRQVAVKKMLSAQYERAQKEVDALVKSDQHPNVVRYFCLERDAEFAYIALERCTCSLHDLIMWARGRPVGGRGTMSLELSFRKEDFWISGDMPSKPLLGLLKNVVKGLVYLHSNSIIHRDLKPHNILVNVTGDRMVPKICDMGISKFLEEGSSSLDSQTGSVGSSGWRAPEQFRPGEKQGRSVDMFSLGCLLFFCITGGEHPFGPQEVHRDSNILKSQFDLFPIFHLPEAHDLIKSLLADDPKDRLDAKQVLDHPFFWDQRRRLDFLTRASDKVEHEDRVIGSKILEDLEAMAADVFKEHKNQVWLDCIDKVLIDNAKAYRKYDGKSIRDLLRLIRNRKHHFEELPQDVKALLGPNPEGIEIYFRQKVPRLLMGVYSVVKKHEQLFDFLCKRSRA